MKINALKIVELEFFIFFLFCFRFVTMKRFTNIIKPAEDTRLYRGLKLENGLSALVISDDLKSGEIRSSKSPKLNGLEG